MSKFSKIIFFCIINIYGAGSELKETNIQFSLLKIIDGMESIIPIKDSRLLDFLKTKIKELSSLDISHLDEFCSEIKPTAKSYIDLLFRYKMLTKELSTVDEIYKLNDELKILNAKLLEQRNALFNQAGELASSERTLKQDISSLLSLRDQYDKEIEKLNKLKDGSESEKEKLYDLLCDLSSNYESLNSKLETLMDPLDTSDDLSQISVDLKKDLESLSKSQDNLLSRFEIMQEHAKSNIALELEKDALKTELVEKNSVLNKYNHPVALSALLVSGIFVTKKIFDFTTAKLFYGSNPLKQSNETRIRNIIQEYTGKTFNQLKIRTKTVLGSKLSSNVSYLQTYNEQFLFIPSNSFIELLSDNELKYAVLRELLFVSYNYELKKLIRLLVTSSVLSGVASTCTAKNSTHNKYIALYSIVISELIFYVLDLNSKIKDDLYIDNFGTIDDLNAAISYYKKIPHYSYVRNRKINFFKLAINKIKRIL